jgi:hypothetical protein
MVAVLLALIPVELQAEYFPLERGMSWTYQTSTGRAYVKRVVGSDGPCLIVQHGDTERHWIGVTDDGVRVHRSKGVRFDRPLLLFKFPLKAGDAWTGEAREGESTIAYKFTTAGEEDVEVPAGKYRAVRIDWEMGASTGTTWLARGVGSVKERYAGGSGLDLVSMSRPGETWLPLKKGARWTYSTDYDEKTDLVHEVTGTEKVGDVDCFVVEHRSENAEEKRIRKLRVEWLAQTEDGVRIHKVRRGQADLAVGKPYFKLKSALRKDDEWAGEATASENPTKTSVIVEEQEEVKVPAGTYACWKLKVKVESGTRHRAEGWEWYAKDVGMVKSDITISASGEDFQIVSELKKFEAGK